MSDWPLPYQFLEIIDTKGVQTKFHDEIKKQYNLCRNNNLKRKKIMTSIFEKHHSMKNILRSLHNIEMFLILSKC